MYGFSTNNKAFFSSIPDKNTTTTTTTMPKYDTFADLPSTAKNGDVVLVLQTTGTLFTRKGAGHYIYKNNKWKRIGIVSSIINELKPQLIAISDDSTAGVYTLNNVYWARNFTNGKEAYRTNNKNTNKLETEQKAIDNMNNGTLTFESYDRARRG